MIVILALAAAAAGLSPDDASAAKAREDLQAMYQQSCEVRAYGSYDDLCNVLKDRMRDFDREQAKAARERRLHPAPTPVAAPTAPPAAASAPAKPTVPAAN